MADKSDSLINENCSRADAASSEADVMDLMSASASDDDAVETVKKRRPDKHRDRQNNSSDCAVLESGATNKRKALHTEFISDDADGDGMEQSDRDGEEYDAASKLLMSIQVLPRIPKKKQVVDEDITSAAECSKPYRSVLERAGSANNRSLGSLTNWSTSGWTRGNDVNIQSSKAKRKDHDHKDRSGLSKWVKDRPPASSYSNNKPEDKKTLTKAPMASTSSENRHDTQKVSGPLPTLPFEEQMRERARLRALQMSESSKVCAAGSLFDAVIGQPSNESNRKSLYELDIASGSDTSNSIRMNVTDISSSPAPGSLSNVSAENDISDDSTDMRTKQLSKVVKNTEIDRLKRIEHASISSKAHDYSAQQSHKTDNGSVSSDSRQLLTKSDPPSPPLPVLPILPLFASICSTTVTDSVVSTVNKSSKLMNLPLLAAVPGNTESLPNTSAAPDVIEGQGTARATASNGSKTVTFNCPEDDPKEKKSKSKKHVKNHKRESKANVQQQIIDEMKNYLRPYYVRRQITKDEYKDIMRRAVPRICRRQSNQPSMSASHVHKYADAYVDSVLKRRQGNATKQDSTVKSKQSSSQQRHVADQLPAKNM